MGPRELIKQALERRFPEGLSISDIREDLEGALDSKQLSNNLYLLKQDCVIEQDEEKRYFLVNAPAATEAAPAPMVDLVAKAEQSRSKPEETVEAAEVVNMSEDLANALERLSVPSHSIADSGLKVAVLNRLAEILDPSIAEVLEGIKTDLVAVSG